MFWPLADGTSEPTETIVRNLTYFDFGQYTLGITPTYPFYPPQIRLEIANSSVTAPQLGWAPVARDDFFALLGNGTLEIELGDLLENDLDYDDAPDPLDVPRNGSGEPIVVDQPQHGTLDWNATLQKFIYTPTQNYLGEDHFTYRATDGDWESNVATVAIAVVQRPDIEFDATQVNAFAMSWLNAQGKVNDLAIGIHGIRVTGAEGVYRAAQVTAAATDDDFISRDTSEAYYFNRPLVASRWGIHRGTDHNHPQANWRREVMGISDEDYAALSGPEQDAINSEFSVWLESHVTAQRMSGILEITYEYAAWVPDGHPWVEKRESYNLFPSELTPPESSYPYGRPMNADRERWLQKYSHSADQPAGWNFTSTLTIMISYHIDREMNIATVIGTATIDDIDGVSVVNISPTVEE